MENMLKHFPLLPVLQHRLSSCLLEQRFPQCAPQHPGAPWCTHRDSTGLSQVAPLTSSLRHHHLGLHKIPHDPRWQYPNLTRFGCCHNGLHEIQFGHHYLDSHKITCNPTWQLGDCRVAMTLVNLETTALLFFGGKHTATHCSQL